MNNDVSSLYVEIIDKNRARMHDLWPKVVEERKNWNPLELCSRQRWETTQANHIRKYKRYLDDPSVPVPKSTRLDHNKRSATRSNTASHLDSSVGLSTELAVVPTESSASHNGENICTRDRSNYMRLQRCIGILVCPKHSRAWKGVERTKIQGCHFILQVKFYTRPTRYRTILLIADSEKNNK